jgi:hypothetical protein
MITMISHSSSMCPHSVITYGAELGRHGARRLVVVAVPRPSSHGQKPLSTADAVSPQGSTPSMVLLGRRDDGFIHARRVQPFAQNLVVVDVFHRQVVALRKAVDVRLLQRVREGFPLIL